VTQTDAGWVRVVVDSYVAELSAAVRSIDQNWIRSVSVTTARKLGSEGARLFAQGNGGSSCIVDSFVHELTEKTGEALRGRISSTWPLNQHIHAIQRDGFAESNWALLRNAGFSPADVLYLVSGSGNSKNLVRMMTEAMRIEAAAFSITGADGGRLAALSGNNLSVESSDQQVVEDTAASILLILASELSREITGRPASAADPVSWTAFLVETLGQIDASWIDAASDKVVQAITEGGKVSVMAPEGGSVAAVAEHIEHNIAWDLTHGYDLVPDVRWGATAAQYTALINDTGDPESPARRALNGLVKSDFVLLLTLEAEMLKSYEEAGLSDDFFAVLGQDGSKPVRPTKACAAEVVSGERSIHLVVMQAFGHLILRCARGKLAGVMDGQSDHLIKGRIAAKPIAPMKHFFP